MVVTIADETGRMNAADPTIAIYVRRLYAPVGNVDVVDVVEAVDDTGRVY